MPTLTLHPLMHQHRHERIRRRPGPIDPGHVRPNIQGRIKGHMVLQTGQAARGGNRKALQVAHEDTGGRREAEALARGLFAATAGAVDGVFRLQDFGGAKVLESVRECTAGVLGVSNVQTQIHIAIAGQRGAMTGLARDTGFEQTVKETGELLIVAVHDQCRQEGSKEFVGIFLLVGAEAGAQALGVAGNGTRVHNGGRSAGTHGGGEPQQMIAHDHRGGWIGFPVAIGEASQFGSEPFTVFEHSGFVLALTLATSFQDTGSNRDFGGSCTAIIFVIFIVDGSAALRKYIGIAGISTKDSAGFRIRECVG